MRKNCSGWVRVLSMVLVFAMMSTCFVFANSDSREALSKGSTVEAAYSKLQRSIQDDEQIVTTSVVYDAFGNHAEVADLSNGDILIWVFEENGNLLSTSCFDRSNRLLYQYYEDDHEGVTIQTIGDPSESPIEEYCESTEAGGQRYIVPANADTGARVTCTGNNYGTKTIDIYGEYNLVIGAYYTRNQVFHDFAAFVSELSTVLSSPGFIISDFANLLLTVAGIALNTIDFLIYVKVRCNKEYVTWKTFDIVTSNMTSFTGIRYNCEEYQGVDYSHDDGTGNYFSIDSLRQYKTSLAVRCYRKLYGNDSVTVSYWTNVW